MLDRTVESQTSTLLRTATDATTGTADYRCFAVDHDDGSVGKAKKEKQQVGKKEAKKQSTFNIPMRDGTPIFMSGRDFQSTFVHGVPKSVAKTFKSVWRINVTIRAWS